MNIDRWEAIAIAVLLIATAGARPKLPPPAIFVNITYLVTDLTQVEGSERE